MADAEKCLCLESACKGTGPDTGEIMPQAVSSRTILV